MYEEKCLTWETLWKKHLKIKEQQKSVLVRDYNREHYNEVSGFITFDKETNNVLEYHRK